MNSCLLPSHALSTCRSKQTNSSKLSNSSNGDQKVVVTSKNMKVEVAGVPTGGRQLRRLPHVYCKWIELPFAAETNVEVEESMERYKFVVRQAMGLRAADVVAEVVEIVPGAMKVRLRGEDRILRDAASGRMKLNFNKVTEEATRHSGPCAITATTGKNIWRARLPACAMVEAAASSYNYAWGVLTITIPKLPPNCSAPLASSSAPRVHPRFGSCLI